MSLKLEIKRKVWHILVGCLIIVGLYREWLDYKLLVFITIGFLILMLIYRKIKLPIVSLFVDNFERDSTKFAGIGAINYLFGVTISVILFPKEVAMGAIAILAFGDGVAPVIGWFGNIPYFGSKKNWEGIFGAIILSVIATIPFVDWRLGIPAAVITMMIEGLDIYVGKRKFDDNLLIPIFAGTIMVLAGRFFL